MRRKPVTGKSASPSQYWDHFRTGTVPNTSRHTKLERFCKYLWSLIGYHLSLNIIIRYHWISSDIIYIYNYIIRASWIDARKLRLRCDKSLWRRTNPLRLQDRLLQPRARAPLRPAIKTAAINSHQRSAEVLSIHGIHQFSTILSGDVESSIRSIIFYPTRSPQQQWIPSNASLIDGTYMCTSASKHCTDATGLATASWGSDTSPPKYPHRHGSWSKTAAWMAWFGKSYRKPWFLL